MRTWTRWRAGSGPWPAKRSPGPTDGAPEPCLTCGTLTAASHCAEHTPHPPDLRRGRDRSHLGRGTAWDRLSKRARALQHWCLDCGTREDLTADHTPAAWPILARGRSPSAMSRWSAVPATAPRSGEPGLGTVRRVARNRNLRSWGRPRGCFPRSEGYCAPGVRPRIDYASQLRLPIEAWKHAGSYGPRNVPAHER